MALYRVIGASKADGTDVNYLVEANNDVHARQVANSEGVLVSSIALAPSAPPLPAPPPPGVSTQRRGIAGAIFTYLTGAASELSVEAGRSAAAAYLLPNEPVLKAFGLVRDMYIFTDRRLILLDKTGLTGKRQQWMFIPYKNIIRFSIETAGHFDVDAELYIWMAGSEVPLKREFRKDSSVQQICLLLAHFTLEGPT